MNTQQISIDQLVDLIKDLDEVDKIQIRTALEEEFNLSEDALKELLQRKAAFRDGKISSISWNDIAKNFGPL